MFGFVLEQCSSYLICLAILADKYRNLRCLDATLLGIFNAFDYIPDAVKAGAAIIVAEKVRDVCVGGAAILKIDKKCEI